VHVRSVVFTVTKTEVVGYIHNGILILKTVHIRQAAT
jgi:hypothetical protein